jgi:hypothetical protein
MELSAGAHRMAGYESGTRWHPEDALLSTAQTRNHATRTLMSQLHSQRREPDMTSSMKTNAKAYLIGAGIGSMAAAAFMSSACGAARVQRA